MTPCLAMLLDTPQAPGVVVEYRCARAAGHGPTGHRDPGGREWDSAPEDVLPVGDRTATVTWAASAVYPAPDGTARDADPVHRIPPRSTTPWAQASSDARHATPS